MRHKIGAVINYCSNDYKFIHYNIKAVANFAKKIIVSTADHFFDGTPENSSILEKSQKENPQSEFVRFKFNLKKRVQPYWYWRLRRILKLPLQSGSQYWICYQRLFGYNCLIKKADIDYVLFLDADEILDSKKFILWLDTFAYKQYRALKFANYWYFRSPRYRATIYEDTPLMAQAFSLDEKGFFSYSEREGMYQKIGGKKRRMVFGLDGKPMVHHYGWVRTKEEMVKKVQTWGHNRDCNWEKLVKEEFSRGFNGTDFIQGYKYKKVEPFILELNGLGACKPSKDD